MPQDQTSKITTKNIWTGVVIVVAVLLLVWWYVALRLTPQRNAISPEVLKSLTASGTSTTPISKKVINSLTAATTTPKPISPGVLQNLTAPN